MSSKRKASSQEPDGGHHVRARVKRERFHTEGESEGEEPRAPQQQQDDNAAQAPAPPAPPAPPAIPHSDDEDSDEVQVIEDGDVVLSSITRPPPPVIDLTDSPPSSPQQARRQFVGPGGLGEEDEDDDDDDDEEEEDEDDEDDEDEDEGEEDEDSEQVLPFQPLVVDLTTLPDHPPPPPPPRRRRGGLAVFGHLPPGITPADLSRARLIGTLARVASLVGAAHQFSLFLPQVQEPAGVRQTELRALRKFSLDSDSENKCCICLDDMKRGQQVRKLKCVHYFHVGCIDKWLERSRACPVCKHQI